MITLARLSLGQAGDFVDLRQKIFQVSRTLGYGEVDAGRFATGWSQLIRNQAAALVGAALTVVIDTRAAPSALRFHLDGPAVSDTPLGLLRIAATRCMWSRWRGAATASSP